MIPVSRSLSLQGEQIDRRCREQLEWRLQESLLPRVPVQLCKEGPLVSHEPPLLRGIHLFVLLMLTCSSALAGFGPMFSISAGPDRCTNKSKQLPLGCATG